MTCIKIPGFLRVKEFSLFTKMVLFLLIAGLIPLILFEKGEIVLMINSYANEYADNFFMIITYAGQGAIWIPVFLILLFLKFHTAFTALLVLMFNGLYTAILKKLLFKGLARPTAYLPEESFYYLIEGFSYHSSNTFPSGHTLTAFSLAFFLSFYIKNNTLSVIVFIYAVLIGFSRIYLLQHFYIDVYFGIITGWLCFVSAQTISESLLRLHEKKIWNKSLRIQAPKIISRQVGKDQ